MKKTLNSLNHPASHIAETKRGAGILTSVLLCLLVVVTGCNKDEDSGVQTMPAGFLLSVVDSNSYNVENFTEELSKYPCFSENTVFNAPDLEPMIYSSIGSLLNLAVQSRSRSLDSLFAARVGTRSDGSKLWDIESYVFTYRSVSHTGRPITLSARITFPNNTIATRHHEVSTLTLCSHQMLILPNSAPYHAMSPIHLHALYNSAVIEPDYEGLGVDSNSLGFIGFSYHATARQMHDCINAAMQLMHRHGVSLAADGYTTNWGSSLGAGHALAYQYYYETRATQAERNAIRLRSTFISEGAPDINSCLLYGSDHPDFSTPLSLYFVNFSHVDKSLLHGYSVDDFIAEWMKDVRIPFAGKEYNYFEGMFIDLPFFLPNIGDYQPDGYTASGYKWNFASDMITADGNLDMSSPKTQAFLSIIEEQSSIPSNWVPKHTIYFSHSPKDEMMPYVPARQLYESLHSKSPDKVHWMDVPSSENTITRIVGMHTATCVFLQFYMALAHEPEDMGMFYTPMD